MVGAPVDADLPREGTLDAAEHAGGKLLGRGVIANVPQGLLDLLEPLAVAAKGGVLVAKALVLAEETAVLLLQTVEIANVAEEIGHGAEG